MNKSLMALAALGSAGLASVCCAGPLVLAGLGAGSLGLAAGLSRYRPLFLALSGVILAVSFYFVYRKRPVACAEGSCEPRPRNRGAKAALWAVTLLAAAMAAFPRCSSQPLTGSRAPVAPGAIILSLRISGMDCAPCALGIRRSVEKVPGVSSAYMDFDGRIAKVYAGPGTDPRAVLKAVAEAGYEAELLTGGNNENRRRR